MSTVIVTTPEALQALVRQAVEEALEARQNAGPLLLDRANTARVLGVGVSTIDRFRHQGMPCVMIGETPRFIVDECLQWLREHRRDKTSADTADAHAHHSASFSLDSRGDGHA